VPLTAEAIAAQPGPSTDAWFRSREKVVWDWPYAEDWLIEELD
jgi:hypothetical protein